AHPVPQALGQVVGEELPAPEADAVGRVPDQRSARLDVARAGLPERAGEGDQLVGLHRVVLGAVELLAQDRSVELEAHGDATTLGDRRRRRTRSTGAISTRLVRSGVPLGETECDALYQIL